MGKNQLIGDKMKKKIWFKRKLYGWGWVPSTWQGWLVVLVYILIVCGVPFVLEFLFGSDRGQDDELIPILIAVAVPLVLTPTLIWIAYKKGEKPTWQWGERVEDGEE